MLKRQFLFYGLTVLLCGSLLSGCNNGDTTSSSGEEEKSQLEINVERLLATKECEGCNLSSAELSDTDLTEVDLANANLSNANLLRADLHLADLYRADLSNAILGNAKMKDANLKDADLTGADLSDATVGGAYFFDSDLRGAIWTDGSTCANKTCGGKAYD